MWKREAEKLSLKSGVCFKSLRILRALQTSNLRYSHLYFIGIWWMWTIFYLIRNLFSKESDVIKLEKKSSRQNPTEEKNSWPGFVLFSSSGHNFFFWKVLSSIRHKLLRRWCKVQKLEWAWWCRRGPRVESDGSMTCVLSPGIVLVPQLVLPVAGDLTF